jgi:hypothetical protein
VNQNKHKRAIFLEGSHPMKTGQIIQWFCTVALIAAASGCQMLGGEQPAAPAPAAPAAPPAPSIPGMPAVAPVAAPVPAVVSTDPMAQKIAAARSIHASDKVETSAMMKATLETGAGQTYQVTLPGAPYCQAIIAVGAETVTNVDVKLALAGGALVAADPTMDATAVISNYCPPSPGLYTVTVSAAAGSGDVAVQIFSK